MRGGEEVGGGGEEVAGNGRKCATIDGFSGWRLQGYFEWDLEGFYSGMKCLKG